MKKYFKIVSLILCLVLNIYVINVKAAGDKNKKTAQKLNINARAAIALDAKSKVVLYEKNSFELIPMASTTKIMTSLVALKYGDLDRKVEISSRAASIRGSVVGYRKGEKITIKELLFGLMLRSGNDAAIAISEGISGSVEEYVKLMNEYAVNLGLFDLHFHSPHGLDDDEHYSTAYDLAMVTVEAKKNKLFNEIVSSKDVDGQKYGFTRSYHNINKILWQIPEADGVKTGYTGKAGKCLVTSAKVKNNDIIIVTLNSPTRWTETKKIYEYVSKNYEYKKVFSKNDIITEVPVKEGSKDVVKLTCLEDVIIPVKNGFNYDIKIKKPNNINGDIDKGDKVGTLYIFENEKLLYSKELNSANSFKKYRINKWFYR